MSATTRLKLMTDTEADWGERNNRINDELMTLVKNCNGNDNMYHQ